MSKNKKFSNKLNHLSPISEKKGLSIVVSYVLLIVLAMSVSVWVYQWLRSSVDLVDSPECPDDVVLAIYDYSYNSSISQLNLTIQNKGYFNVDGFFVRVNNDSDPNFGIYILNESLHEVNVSESVTVKLNSSNYIVGSSNYLLVGTIKVIDVQPYVIEDNKVVVCEKIATEIIS